MAGHLPATSLDWLGEEQRESEEALEYAVTLLEGAEHRRDEVDEYIRRYAPAWPVRHLPVIDRNILRLALFEIRFGEGVPPKVAINEAVELAKTFGSLSSPRFVNGVLGSVMEELASGEDGSVKDAVSAVGNSSREGN